MKNTKEDSEKCKTIIYIDEAIVFTSAAYTWKHPARKDFYVKTGSSTQVKGSIRNISITAYE